MSALTKILTGAAGLAAVVGFASPASAQYYPNYGYGNNNSGVLGQILNGVLGGGQYGQGYGGYGYQNNDRYAVDQCTRAVQARLGGNVGYGGYGYNQYGYNQGYGGGRVLSVTRVERRSSGLRVRGLASSGANYGGYGGYGGGYGGYGYNSQAQADLSFSCKVDYRGRITDIDLDRRNVGYGYRGY